MRRLKVVFLCALVLAICLPGIAAADLIDFGDPIEIGSWAQAFNESGVGSFDAMEVFMVSGASDFNPPGFSNFSGAGWSGDVINPDYAVATGTAQTNMNFNIRFTSNQSTPFAFDFLAWEGGVFGTLKEAAHAVWTGSSWNITAITNPDINGYNRVPIPGALVLLGSGLLGLAGLGWRRSRKEG